MVTDEINAYNAIQ